MRTANEMAHHKRKGPKSTRAGCLLCKPHKHQAERHRDRSRSNRRWHEQELGANRRQVELSDARGPPR